MIEATKRFWTSSDGLRLFARDYPAADGPARLPVICIHGLTRNSKDFEDLAPRLAATGRRVLAIDVRGRGLSDRDPDPTRYNPQVYAGDVAALFAASGLARAHFVGTSMGGLITMALAILSPTLIAGAVLNDVGPEVDPAGLARIASYVGQAPGVGNWDEAVAYVRRINEAAMPALDDEAWRRFARRTFRQGADGRPELDYDPRIMSGVSPAALPDLWPFFAALAAHPLLVVRGETSDILSDAVARRMEASGPRVRRVEISGVGHAPLLDEPEALSAIIAFLDDQP